LLRKQLSGLLNLTFVMGTTSWAEVEPLVVTPRDKVPGTHEQTSRDSQEWLGHLGCTVGHLVMMAAASDSGATAALMLEDDATGDLGASLRPVWSTACGSQLSSSVLAHQLGCVRRGSAAWLGHSAAQPARQRVDGAPP
jgi:hypothetical protein